MARHHKLIKRYVLPVWAGLLAAEITRTDANALMASINAPVVANQVLKSTSAIFSWAIRNEIGGVKMNPCHLVEKNPVKSRERILSDSELPLFWAAFDSAGMMRGMALKAILLTGQRPGEVAHMRVEDIAADGWWTLPRDPEQAWPAQKMTECRIVSGCPDRCSTSLPRLDRSLVGSCSLTRTATRSLSWTARCAIFARCSGSRRK